MEISKNLAANILLYKQNHDLTTVELAEELHLAVSTTQEYLNGNGNPRADTLEMLARQMNLSVTDLISSPHSELVPAAIVLRAAQEFASLPNHKRDRGIQLFLSLVELWASET